MKRRKIKEIGGSFRGIYIRNIADIIPKWKGIRNADIMPNWSDICNTADIPKLSEMPEPVPLLERISHYLHFGKKMVVQIYGYNY